MSNLIFWFHLILALVNALLLFSSIPVAQTVFHVLMFSYSLFRAFELDREKRKKSLEE